MTRRASVLVALAGLSAGASLGTSCHRQVETQCYDVLPRPDVDPTQLPPDLPYCDVTVSTVPDPADGYGFTHRVGAGFVPAEDDPCDPCDVDRFEELLRTAIEERISQGSPSCARTDPSKPVGLCVHEPDGTSDECRVLGVFYSNYHDVPETAGCADCREDGTCDHNP